MVVKVCVGSSCHLRGSYAVIEKMTEIIQKYNVADKIELQASFCLGQCINGVTMNVDECFLHNVNEDNAESLFIEKIMPLLGK